MIFMEESWAFSLLSPHSTFSIAIYIVYIIPIHSRKNSKIFKHEARIIILLSGILQNILYSQSIFYYESWKYWQNSCIFFGEKKQNLLLPSSTLIKNLIKIRFQIKVEIKISSNLSNHFSQRRIEVGSCSFLS